MGRTFYVDANANRDGNGSAENPFRVIGRAADLAGPGDEILVLPGVYREHVSPRRGGTSEHDRIIYRSTVVGAAIITGADVIDQWQQFSNDLWVASVSNEHFGEYNPYTTEIYGDWYRGMGRINHTGQIYYNGEPLCEESTLNRVANPVSPVGAWAHNRTRMTWYAEQDKDTTKIYANFQGNDPNAALVEFNVRRNVFFPKQTGVDYITLTGFTLRQAATQWAPPTAFQDGLVGPHWSKGWIIEDCSISDSRCCGVSLGKRQHHFDNRWTSDRVKSGTQLERDAVMFASNTDWKKQSIGSHIIRRNRIFRCGQAGIVGHLGGVFSIIEDNEITDISTTGEFSGSELGGIKLHAAIDTIIQRNHIHHCHRGLWLDWQTQGTRVTRNLFHHNDGEEDTRKSEDLYIEVSHGPALVDNNIFLSRFPLRERSQGMAFVHNLIAGPIDIGTAMGRFTPYHNHHETSVMGFMTILGGDNRFYNNLIIQRPMTEDMRQVANPELAKIVGMNPLANIEAGLHVYDDFPVESEFLDHFFGDSVVETAWGRRFNYGAPLPMYVSGNVYLGGAKPYCKEGTNYVNSALSCSEIEVVCRDGKYYLETNAPLSFPAISTKIVSTQSLGKAFQPEQFFENPDGSALSIDIDYFGNARGTSPTPGPFENRVNQDTAVW